MPHETRKPVSFDPPVIQQAVSFISTWLDHHFQDNNIPGLSFSIHKNDQPLLNRHWGVTNQETQAPLNDRHAFRVASVSKMFTAAAIGILADEGRLGFDDKLTRHLPALGANRDLRNIRLRHLLSHTSGLSREGNIPGDHWNLEGDFPSESFLIEHSKTMKPVFNRTGKLKYSNWGYGLLGQIVAAASGQSYSEFVQARMIENIGLSATFTDAPDVPEEQRMAAHFYTNTRTPRIVDIYMPTGGLIPATGFCSTPSDLCLFLHAFQNGLVKKETRDFLLKPINIIDKDPESLMGHGFMTTGNDQFAMSGHGGFFTGQTAAAYAHPASGISIAACSNSQDTDTAALVEGAWETFRQFHEYAQDLKTAQSRKLSGLYQNSMERFYVLATPQNASLLDLAEENPWAEAEYLTSEDGGRTYNDGEQSQMEWQHEPMQFSAKGDDVFLQYKASTYKKTLKFS